MLRGRIRKLGLKEDFNVLVENTSDIENGVRFGVIKKEHAIIIIKYLESIIDEVAVEKVLSSIENPVLSKLKVNKTDRYKL